MSKNTVVLAYSGGLDTSVAIQWLQENYGLEVVTVTVNAGQDDDFPKIKETALKSGAKEAYIIEAQIEFVNEFILPALKANALYERHYPLISSLTRPLIAKHVVEVAEKIGSSYVAHGCTGKGNDQVRFEISFAALNPGLKIIAPLRESKMSREEAIEYAEEKNIPIEVSKKSPYSIDENIWGRAIECGVLEDAWREPPEEIYKLTKNPTSLDTEPEYVEITFKDGKPVELNNKKIELIELIRKIGEIAGSHGFGRIDMIENRFVGIKSREIYEAPSALSLIIAHQDLEKLTMEKDLYHFKEMVESRFAELIYNGYWHSPLREALDSFINKSQENTTGTVRLKFFKGNCSVVGRKSEKSLYDLSLASYEKGKDSFSHDSAKGFIDIIKLPIALWAKKKKKV
ncbi:MAG: argininosuccinate synthase [Actinomycetia bacterium]|nr:argininosuccinate synthase [Actinomycetes bacterium]